VWIFDLLELMSVLLATTNKALKTGTYGIHQFGDSGHIPVRICDLDVPQIRRQSRESHVNIHTLPIPCEKATADESVGIMPLAA
jgi:hypothetical protein